MKKKEYYWKEYTKEDLTKIYKEYIEPYPDEHNEWLLEECAGDILEMTILWLEEVEEFQELFC